MRSVTAVWTAALAVVAASCAKVGSGPVRWPVEQRTPPSPWTARSVRSPSPLLAAVRSRPELQDLVLYLRARDAVRGGDDAAAIAFATRLADGHPDSIWLGSVRLLAGQVRRRAGDLEDAERWLLAARDALSPGGERWVAATLALGDVRHRRDDDAGALELARAVRGAKPGDVASRRARRLVERIRRRHPDLFASTPSRLAEAELLLGEDDATGAALEAAAVLDTSVDPDERAHALWIRARAERALGQRSDAEATCLETARLSDTYGPKALAAAARWRWNGDDDAGALRIYRQLVSRFPAASEAAEARYAVGRIHQEAGHYDEAFEAYDRLAHDEPRAAVGVEARWRAGWVRFLAGDLRGAATYFAAIVADGPAAIRPAAEYWDARMRALLAEPDADARLALVAEEHPTSYYAGLAAERLGRTVDDTPEPVLAPPPPSFPDELPGTHATRARALAELGLDRLAARELDAVDGDAPRVLLAQAYTAIGAPGAAIQAARGSGGDVDDATRRYLYPLGFWDVIERESEARGLDPLLVAALIRQESLYLPDAVSPADAHGLMQLLPRTAREIAADAGVAPADLRRLDVVPTNVRLGTTLLRRLLDRYGGSRVRALAAYNAGEDAVAKWERRYGPRPDDEFAELISYRETRDYVKLVLQNLQVYRRLYAPSAFATSAGSPPKAPFDMMATTSPGWLVATR